MIQDATVFDDEHLPREIVGRNPQMSRVTAALKPIEQDERAENCYLYGPSGAGKTTVARASLRALQERLGDVPTAYVNCWYDSTRAAVLRETVEEMVSRPVGKRRGHGDILKILKSNLDSPAVLILDEADQLTDSKVLYDLHSVKGLSWIAIANREVDLRNALDDRIQSRLGVGFRAIFHKYDDETITEVLDRRAKSGLTRNAVSDDVLEEIAAASDGNARTGIYALKTAARLAEAEGLRSIPTRVVDDAVAEAKSEIRQKNISKLDSHQRVAYEVVRDHGPLIQKELYGLYEEQHSSPLSYKSLRETHLPKLEHYNLIRTEQRCGSKVFEIVC